MPGGVGSPLLAGAAGIVSAAALLGFGYLLADAVFARWRLHRATVWALALPSLVGYVLLLMLAHIATGGAVLSSPLLVRVVTAGAAAGLFLLAVRRRRRAERGSIGELRELLPPAVLVLLGVVLWATPLFRMLPLDHTGDSLLHMGWASQLQNGEALPAGAITGDIPNFYPWMYHSVIAFLSHFVPGGRTFLALHPLQLLQVTGAILALYALGREITGRWVAGAATALFGALAGGVGFVLLRGPDVVLDPRAFGTRYLGDLIFKRSYNSAFYNLSPPFPRDLAFTLLTCFLLLLTVGIVRRSRPLLVSAGVILGMAGLTGAEAFLVGVGASGLVLLLPGQTERLRTGLALFVPAFAVAALWFLPLVLNYLRLGFVNITRVGPVDLPAYAVLAAWGVVTPFALFGLWRWVPRIRNHPAARIPLAVTAVAVLGLLASALVPRIFGRAFLTLGRAHRYWPLLHVGLALYGGIGLSDLLQRLRSRRGLALGLAAAVVLLAVPSPLAASLALPRRLGPGAVFRGALRGRPNQVLNVLAPEPGLPCTAAVPLEASVRVWAYTGYRLVAYRWPNALLGNSARLRWRRIYQEIVPEDERMADNTALVEGDVGPAHWNHLVEKYDLDLVLVPSRFAGAAAFRGLASESAIGPRSERAIVVRVGDCDGEWPLATRSARG